MSDQRKPFLMTCSARTQRSLNAGILNRTFHLLQGPESRETAMNCFSNPGWKVLVLTVEREAGERICKKLMKGRKEGKRKKIKGKQRTRRGKLKRGPLVDILVGSTLPSGLSAASHPLAPRPLLVGGWQEGKEERMRERVLDSTALEYSSPK